MSTNLTSMQYAMINAGLVTLDRAVRFNTIQRDKSRKQTKQPTSATKGTTAKPEKLNQNRK